MRIGISAPQIGRMGDPVTLRAAAAAAEQVGYASLWVVDRMPAAPAEPPALDPVSVLATLAAATRRVRIGTSVLVAGWYRPEVLGRAVRSLDVLSEGRLTVGLGVGRPGNANADAFAERERRLDAAIDVLDRLDRRPPVLIGGNAPHAVERAGRRADGWMPENLSAVDLTDGWRRVRACATEHGRDPGSLELVVRAEVALLDRAAPGTRSVFEGTAEQVADDLDAARVAGANEVILAPWASASLDETLDVCARIADTLGVRG
jgi:alkanesulfonate monooxygenase SsuD/methylene tetrahydromethanopterin reductase-like flavin-dependent oxidoreductase (luciferase family)